MRLTALFLLIAVPAFGAIARVGSCSTFDDPTTDTYTSFSLSPAMNVAAGNLVVIVSRGSSAASSVTVGGVSATSAVSLGRNNYSTIWYVANAAANASATITVNATSNPSYVAGIACQYSGVATVSPLDATATDNATWPYPQNTATSNAFTTASANELIIGGGGNASPYTAGSGFTLFGSTSTSLALEDEIVSTIQTGVTATLIGSSYSYPNLLVATFKAALAVATSQALIF